MSFLLIGRINLWTTVDSCSSIMVGMVLKSGEDDWNMCLCISLYAGKHRRTYQPHSRQCDICMIFQLWKWMEKDLFSKLRHTVSQQWAEIFISCFSIYYHYVWVKKKSNHFPFSTIPMQLSCLIWFLKLLGSYLCKQMERRSFVEGPTPQISLWLSAECWIVWQMKHAFLLWVLKAKIISFPRYTAVFIRVSTILVVHSYLNRYLRKLLEVSFQRRLKC